MLLAATFSTQRDGGYSNFLFGLRPNAPMWGRSLAAMVFHTRIGLLEAALHLRRVGPNHLRSLSMSELQSNLTNFLTENYGLIAERVWLRRDEAPYSEVVDPASKLALAVALSKSDHYCPEFSERTVPKCLTYNGFSTILGGVGLKLVAVCPTLVRGGLTHERR
ncbi:MAG: hypothetical protein EXR07_15480, partial [Acetobacteraceae bacterium]|nr:hypothetical protein [Acetobacteraceae bacterium]